MEWVETTGRTIEDAKEAALDQLGVDESEAEFEILEEPRLGLFGRLRNEGRVRARVRPVAPRPKDERRRRGRTASRSSEPGRDSADAPAGTEDESAGAEPAAEDETGTSSARAESGRRAPKSQSRPRAEGPRRNPRRTGEAERTDRSEAASREESEAPPRERPASGSSNGGGGGRGGGRQGNRRGSTREEGTEVDVPLEEQTRVAEEFLQGLVGEFGITADITTSQPDDDTVDVSLEGEGLGILIGPKGATLLSLQDLTRTVVQRQTGAGNGRIHVDISGYRQKRAEALTRFARQVADEVRASGVRKAMEPMSAPDRKVVHDALTEVEGVSTVSEGEDAARRVVILPETADA